MTGSDRLDPPTLAEPSSPAAVVQTTIDLQRLGVIRAHEVLESDLISYEQQIAREQQALGYANFFGGALISLLLTSASVSTPTTLQLAVFIGGGIAFTAGTAFFWQTWRRERRNRPRVIEVIRGGRSQERRSM